MPTLAGCRYDAHACARTDELRTEVAPMFCCFAECLTHVISYLLGGWISVIRCRVLSQRKVMIQ